MASPSRTPTPADVAVKEAAERARRVAAMLDRWNHDDVTGEPEWSVEELAPMTLRAQKHDEESIP